MSKVVEQKRHAQQANQVRQLMDSVKKLPSLFHSPNQSQSNDELKLQAFKKIYAALYAGQTTIFKHASLLKEKKLTIEMIEKHVKGKNITDNRSAFAWQLAQQFFAECHSGNKALFWAIHNWSYHHSGLFSRTKVKVKGETSGLTEGPTRSGRIVKALNSL